MKILDYVKSLLPTFKRDTVLEDCRLTHTEIKEHTAPSYAAAAELLGKWKFKSPELEKPLGIFSRMVSKGSKDNIIVVINKSFKTILDNLTVVEKLIEKTYNEEVAGGGFTYQKANLLQFIEATTFVSKFARKFLIYVYICESAQYEESADSVKESLTPFEIEWLENNFVAFCTAFNAVTTPTDKVESALGNIPDIVITEENASTIPVTMGAAKVDPLQMGLIPIWMNPIYHVGMFIAEWQASRYKASKEEVRLLQLRKLNLEKLADGKPDAALQKEIKYMEERIQNLNFKITKMEKENGL